MALAGRVLIFPDLGSACSCTEGRDVLAPRGQVTRVAQAEQAGMAELLWGQPAAGGTQDVGRSAVAHEGHP